MSNDHLCLPANSFLTLLCWGREWVCGPYLDAATQRITLPEEMLSGIKLRCLISYSPKARRQSRNHVNSDLIATDKYTPPLFSYIPVTCVFSFSEKQKCAVGINIWKVAPQACANNQEWGKIFSWKMEEAGCCSKLPAESFFVAAGREKEMGKQCVCVCGGGGVCKKSYAQQLWESKMWKVTGWFITRETQPQSTIFYLGCKQ